MKNPRPTIKKVASAAGVSTQTISRVINNRPDVSPETRRRVQAVIASLDYRPSSLARSLIQQRSFTLGVVTAGLKYAGVARSLNGIAARAEEMGYTLLLKELPGFAARDVLPVVHSLLARQVDGLLWAVPEVGENRDWLDTQQVPLPCVFLSMHARPGVSVVTVDNLAGASLAVRHLVERGCRNIGHVAGPQDWWEGRQRLQGWREALSAAGLPAEEQQVVEGNWSSASGSAAFEQLARQFPEMDAVFVANDQMALAVLQSAAAAGIAVPARLAVVGFDGLPETAFYWPPLTTIFQDQQAVGAAAVELLVRQIEAAQSGESQRTTEYIPIMPALVIRSSS